MFATSLYDGEQASFYRQDFAGILRDDVWEEVRKQYDFRYPSGETIPECQSAEEGMEP